MELLKVGYVAEIFGVYPSTVRDWISRGKLESKKTLGGHNRITRESVEKLQEELNHKSTYEGDS